MSPTTNSETFYSEFSRSFEPIIFFGWRILFFVTTMSQLFLPSQILTKLKSYENSASGL